VEGQRPYRPRFDRGTPARPGDGGPVTRSGLVPYRFESRTRTWLPPRLTRTTCRTVWFVKPSDQFDLSGRVVSLPGTGDCIADAQVADHRAAG